jgi:hypothetical protein
MGLGDWGSGIFNTIANGVGQLKKDGRVVILILIGHCILKILFSTSI